MMGIFFLLLDAGDLPNSVYFLAENKFALQTSRVNGFSMPVSFGMILCLQKIIKQHK